MHRRHVLRILAGLPLIAAACRKKQQSDELRTSDGKLRLVFKYQPLGAGNFLEKLLSEHEKREPEVRIVTEALPNASDLAHQFFLTALGGGSRDFDVFIVDTIWVAEFARAGFLLDLSHEFPVANLQRDFLSGAAEAVVLDGKTFAVPWYADVGLLYRRADLVSDAPKTYAELSEACLRVLAERAELHGLRGFVWQGRQYEGLVCNAYEAIWGHGGATLAGERVLVDTSHSRRALTHMRSLIERGISPSSVTSAAEEDSRRLFQDGRAVFMRNWPYALTEAEREGSAIRGRVDISALPTLDGSAGNGALGGYHLAINAHIHEGKRAAALSLLETLSSRDANVGLARAYGRSPARRAAYETLMQYPETALIARLQPMLERAKSRPVTPYYSAISDTLQSEFSAIVSGIRSAPRALARAQALVDHITGFSA